MKKIDVETVEQIREYAIANPETSYTRIAATFGLSLVSVKRYCANLRNNRPSKGSNPSKPDPGRFWSLVDKAQPDDCWLWTGCLNNSGYGFIFWGGKNLATHRLAYQLTCGAIAEGLEIDHSCRNRACCNPRHLTPVTHKTNLERAGRIPTSGRAVSERQSTVIDTRTSIDTDPSSRSDPAENIMDHYVKDSIKAAISADQTGDVSVSMPVSVPAQMPPQTAIDPPPAKFLITTPHPPRPSPFAPVCVMQPPAEIVIEQHPPRHEGPSGTKADLDITDWAETEYGPFWWDQTDEYLSTHPVSAQTEAARERGEYLHWYRVMPIDTSKNHHFMSARTGPEACIKVERCLGRGWAFSWEYVRPDPHRGTYRDYHVRMTNNELIPVVARTVVDAIAMVEEIWGGGKVLQCDEIGRAESVKAYHWSVNWRSYLENAKVYRKRFGKLVGRPELPWPDQPAPKN